MNYFGSLIIFPAQIVKYTAVLKLGSKSQQIVQQIFLPISLCKYFKHLFLQFACLFFHIMQLFLCEQVQAS